MTEHGCLACKNNAERTKNKVLFLSSNNSVPHKKIKNPNHKYPILNNKSKTPDKSTIRLKDKIEKWEAYFS